MALAAMVAGAPAQAQDATNADLFGLNLSQGALTSPFNPATTSYTANVANGVASLGVTAIASDAAATVSINGAAARAGSASSDIALAVGANTVSIRVTAADRATTRTYTLTVNRASTSPRSGNKLTIGPLLYHWRTMSEINVGGTPPPPVLGMLEEEGSSIIFPNGQSFPTPIVPRSDSCYRIEKVSATFNDPFLGDIQRWSTINLKYTNGQPPCVATFADIPIQTTLDTVYVADIIVGLTNTPPVFIKTEFDVPRGQTTVIRATQIGRDPDGDPLGLSIVGEASGPGCGKVVRGVGNGGSVDITPSEAGGVCRVPITISDIPATFSATLVINVPPAPPTVTALAPATGPEAGGTSVVITGTGFTDATGVSFGGAPATSFTVNSATQITAIAPAGTGTVNVQVTTAAGTSDTAGTADDYVYTAPSTNADLASLALSQGTLSPVFATGTTDYTASVANDVTSLTLTPTAADAGATITVNGTAVTSGTPSSAIVLAVGTNTITTVVTAADGTTTRTYTVTVTRAASANADLASLALSQGTLSPAFAAGTTSYSASVANGVTSLTLTPTTADAGATITVNGAPIASGNATIALAEGSNTITTVVTAADGTTTRTYTLIVTRAASANADLVSLALSQGSLSPTFAPGTTSYSASVANSVTSLTLTPTAADGGATIMVNGAAVASGSASGPIALAVGANTITTVVTAADGTTTRTYTVVVTRAASANADLASLALSQGTLSPAFASGTTSYSASVANSVTSLTLTPTAADGGATITVNGTAVASGSTSGAIALAVGTNTITTVVTAPDGTTTRTYTVTVTRAAPLVIAVAPSTEQRFGAPFLQENRASGGSGRGFVFALESGALPAGTGLDPATGTVSGTPAAAGAYRYTVSVTDSAGERAISAPIEGMIAKAPQTIAFPPLADAPLTAGTVTLSASASSGLPAVFTSRSPTVCTVADRTANLLAPGLCVIAADQPGGPNHDPADPVVRSFTVTAPALVWNTTGLAPATAGIAYSQQLSASGGFGALGYVVTGGALPAGLSLSADGALTGTPRVGGSFAFSVTVSDEAGGASAQPFTIDVAAATITVGPDSLASGRVGVAYSQTLTASGGNSPYTFALASGSLPPGLSLSPMGTVSGTPTQSGSFALRISATDGSGGTGPFSGSRDYTISIADAPPEAAASALSVPYGAPATPVPLALSGGPVSSLAITARPANGVATLSGTAISYQPRAGFSGRDSFTFIATGPGGTSAPATVAVTVLAPEIAITQTSLPDAVAGEAYSQTLTATGGAAPYRFEITDGSLPAGLALSEAGVISGSPQLAAVGAASFTVTATDASTGTGPFRASRSLTITVRTPATPVVRDAPAVTVVSSTGEQQGETRVELGSLVSGQFTEFQLATLSANGTATLVSGAGQGAAVVYRPNRGFTGTERFQFVAVGPGGTSAPAAITVNVIGTRPTAAALEATTLQGQPVTVDLTATALERPITGAAIVGLTPVDAATATLQEGDGPGDRTYRLTVAPSGRFTGLIRVTYTLTNAWGVSEPAVVTVTVASRPDPSSDPNVQALSDAQAEQARRFAQTQLGNFERRLERLHGAVPRRSSDLGLTGGGAGAGYAGGGTMNTPAGFGGMAADGLATPFGTGAGAGLGRELIEASAGFAEERADTQAAAQDSDPDAVRQVGQVAVWAGGSLMVGTLDQTTLRSQLSVRSQGLSVGMDYKFSDTVTAGFGLGLGWDSSDVSGGLASADATNRVGALYGSIRLGEGVFLDMVGGYGTLDMDTKRVVGAGEMIARAAREGDMLFGSASFALDRVDGNIRWSTYAQVQALHASLGAYTESGAGLGSLTYAGREVDSLVGVIGGRMNTALDTPLGLLLPSLRIDWRHEFSGLSVQRLDYADLVGTGQPQFALAATRFARNELNIELGTELNLSPDWALAMELGARHSSVGTLGTGRMVLRWRF